MPSHPRPPSKHAGAMRQVPYPQKDSNGGDTTLQIPRTPSQSHSRSPSVGRSALSSPAVSTTSTIPDGDLSPSVIAVAMYQPIVSSKSKRIRSYADLPDPRLRETGRRISQIIHDHTIFICPFFASLSDWEAITKNGFWLEVVKEFGYRDLEYDTSLDILVEKSI
jgi:hypothetical protein